jgi:hypothetical protein
MTADFNYFPFEAGDGSELTESRWKLMFTWMRSVGVLSDTVPLPSGSDLDVSPSSPGLAVEVETGEAFIQGMFWSHTGDPAGLNIEGNSSGDDRIDLVVLRCDFVNDIMEYVVIEGIADPSPVAPSPVQNSTIWDLPLAEVYVEDGASVIDSMDITDVRVRSVQGDSDSPICVVRRTGNVTVNNGASDTLSWQVADLNTDSMWDSMTNPQRVTIPEDGVYEIKFQVVWGGGASADGTTRTVVYLNNGSTVPLILSVARSLGSNQSTNIGSVVKECDAGDYIYMVNTNLSGINLPVAFLANYTPQMSVRKIRST